MRRSVIAAETLKIALLVFLGAAAWVPVFLALNMSFKTPAEIMRQYWALPAWPLRLENYRDAWVYTHQYLLNSIYVSGLSALLTVFIGSIAGYAFARLRFVGKGLFFGAVLVLLLIPTVVTLIPRFVLARDLGILYTHWGLILPYVAAAQPLTIFLLRGFFAQLPEELIEAARIDGASEFTIYYRIILPLSVPIVVTAGLLNVQTTWNQFIWPLIALRDDSMRPITVGLQVLSSELVGDYGPLMAAYVLSAVPMLILFMFTMRYFVRGLTSGALKQ